MDKCYFCNQDLSPLGYSTSWKKCAEHYSLINSLNIPVYFSINNDIEFRVIYNLYHFLIDIDLEYDQFIIADDSNGDTIISGKYSERTLTPENIEEFLKRIMKQKAFL